MINKILLTIFLFNTSYILSAQTTVFAYRVSFTDKAYSPTLADSANYLSAKALARRAKQGIVVDELDRPISQLYIDSVVKLGKAFRVKNRNKWFNSIVILTKTNDMAAIVATPFVKDVKLVARYPNGWKFTDNTVPANTDKNPATTYFTQVKASRGSPAYYGESYTQIKSTNTDFLHDNGYKGENMNIAFIDMGYKNIKHLKAFDSVIAQNRILDRWNFINDTINVDSFNIVNAHGADALVMMAGNIPGTYVGSAPNANFMLYMSEDYAFESPIEEDNWVSAAERADSMGVDLINTSLGYFIFDNEFSTENYTYANDFDGKTTRIAIGHNLAVSRGIFCVSAMGNMGATPWKVMLTPGDADSTYSVGAMDSNGNFLVSMGSSIGPSSDGQIKPDGIGVGVNVCLIANNTGNPAYTGGTSFSAPLIGGGIACLMQALPNLKVHQIRELVQQSSSRYTSTSDSMGFGVPNFMIAFNTGKVLSNSTYTMGSKNDYYLYPNPAINEIFVSYKNNNLLNATVEVVNMQGKIISKNSLLNSNSFSVAHLNPGVYFARIINEKEIVLKSFIKQ
jgi:serine protease AprX